MAFSVVFHRHRRASLFFVPSKDKAGGGTNVGLEQKGIDFVTVKLTANKR
jgi:hypothetical protein